MSGRASSIAIVEPASRAGFTVDAVVIPRVLSAIRAFERRPASAYDIKRGMIELRAVRSHA